MTSTRRVHRQSFLWVLFLAVFSGCSGPSPEELDRQRNERIQKAMNEPKTSDAAKRRARNLQAPVTGTVNEKPPSDSGR